MKFATKAIHAGIHPDESTGAIMTPIYQTSTYVQTVPGEHKGFEYSRTQNPTRQALENNLAALEKGNHGLCFSSGMAAIDAVAHLLNPGEEIVASNDLYGGTYRLFTSVYKKMGITAHFVDMQNIEAVKKAINKNTRLIWVETPTNPLLNVIDVEAICKLRTDRTIICVDNTFSTPYLQTPLDMGADLVMHSVTKYLSGHSDVIMGALVVKDQKLAEELYFIQNSCGAVPGPQDCFLVLRGIKTLHLRLQRHSENGEKIAKFLLDHKAVSSVYWPGLSTHKNYDIAKKQMLDFGGMVSFVLKEGNTEAAHKFTSKLKIFKLAESLGGVESLAGHPASMTHASIPKEEREKTGVVDGLIRLSVGIEDHEDLVSDLNQALS